MIGDDSKSIPVQGDLHSLELGETAVQATCSVELETDEVGLLLEDFFYRKTALDPQRCLETRGHGYWCTRTRRRDSYRCKGARHRASRRPVAFRHTSAAHKPDRPKSHTLEFVTQMQITAAIPQRGAADAYRGGQFNGVF